MCIFWPQQLVVGENMLNVCNVTPHRPCRKAYFGVSAFQQGLPERHLRRALDVTLACSIIQLSQVEELEGVRSQ